MVQSAGQSGDERDFQQLYEQYGPAVYRICLRFLNHQAEAEDAVQEIFIKVYHSMDQFRGQAKLSTWLYRIAINHCLNQQRNQKRRALLNLEFLQAKDTNSAEEQDPHHWVEKSETAGLIQQAIQALPERQRMALILCRYENKSYQEIAVMMNCSVSAVESCIHHAKKALSVTLKKMLTK